VIVVEWEREREVAGSRVIGAHVTRMRARCDWSVPMQVAQAQ
jgi:hypothetical protein